MGMKLIVVCGLALLMTIPAFFVEGLVDDRTSRAADVIKEISGHVGGQQTFLGPTLAIPFNIPPQSQSDVARHGVYLVFPARASAVLKTATEERHRSLFKVPVFQADLKFDATFDLTGVPSSAPQGAELDWSHAEIVVGVSDARGALADALLTADGKTATLVPAGVSPNLTIGGDQNQQTKLTLFGAKADAVAKPNAQFNVTSSLRFSGAQRVAVLAYGKTTHLAVQGDWPSPGFDGGFLPINRTISSNGFSAEWSVPFIARGVRAEGQSDSIAAFALVALLLTSVGVYGVASYTIVRREKEIGIRSALGATRGQLVQMIVRDGMTPVLAGLAAGALAAALSGRLLSTSLFDVKSADAMVFLSAGVTLIAISVLSNYLPARRAGRISPIAALRND
jgi:inner membrane protein